MLFTVLSATLILLAVPVFAIALGRSGLWHYSAQAMSVWSGLTAFVFALQLLSLNLPEGVNLVYSGAAFLALTLGYNRALLSMGLLLLIVRPADTWPIALWVDAILPVWLMILLVGATRRFLPANPFVFLLGCGFFGLFMVYAVQIFVKATVFAVVQGEPLLSQLISEQTIWSLLLVSGEATLEGMIITVLVVYYPQSVALFDDRFYLTRPM